jgi:hypothetical protein
MLVSLLSQVLEGKADFAGIDYFYCALRQAVACTQVIHVRGLGFLVPLPRKKSTFAASVQPFDTFTWAFLVISLVFMAGILVVLNKTKVVNFSWFHLFTSMFAGEEIKLHETAGRNGQNSGKKLVRLFFPFSTWYLGIGLIILSYSAVVIQFFTNPFEKQAETLEDLVKLNMKFRIGSSSNVQKTLITSSSHPVAKEISKRIVEINDPLDHSPGDPYNEILVDTYPRLSLRIGEMMRRGEDRWKESYIFTEKPGQNILPPLSMLGYFRKDYVDLDLALKRTSSMIENGFLLRIESKHMGQAIAVMKAARENNKATSFQRDIITLENLRGVFFLLLIGLGISLVVFIVEIAYHRHIHRNRMNVCLARK